MKILIKKEELPDNPVNFLRAQGYGYIQGRGDKQDSFAKRLYGGEFPRLHMYVNDRGDKWEFHLHLDQKPVSYKGSNAHSGEYDGDVVETEIKHLEEALFGKQGGERNIKNQNAKIKNNNELFKAEDRIGEGDIEDDIGLDKKKSFWKKLFS